MTSPTEIESRRVALQIWPDCPALRFLLWVRYLQSDHLTLCLYVRGIRWSVSPLEEAALFGMWSWRLRSGVEMSILLNLLKNGRGWWTTYPISAWTLRPLCLNSPGLESANPPPGTNQKVSVRGFLSEIHFSHLRFLIQEFKPKSLNCPMWYPWLSDWQLQHLLISIFSHGLTSES